MAKKIFLRLQCQHAIKGKNSIFSIPLAINILRFTHPDFATLQLDLNNAFGSIPRKYIESILPLYDSHNQLLSHYYNLVYSNPNRILTRGSAHTSSSIGILQGDPLATLIFCIALQPTINLALHGQSEIKRKFTLR